MINMKLPSTSKSYSDFYNILTNFSELVTSTSLDFEHRLSNLEIIVSQIVLHCANFEPEFDDLDYPEVPNSICMGNRNIINKLFPEFGYYNICENVVDSTQTEKLLIGDVIDDILDVFNGSAEFLWRYENHSKKDAYWTFHYDYKTHLNEHLVGIQYYMFYYKREQTGY